MRSLKLLFYLVSKYHSTNWHKLRLCACVITETFNLSGSLSCRWGIEDLLLGKRNSRGLSSYVSESDALFSIVLQHIQIMFNFSVFWIKIKWVFFSCVKLRLLLFQLRTICCYPLLILFMSKQIRCFFLVCKEWFGFIYPAELKCFTAYT